MNKVLLIILDGWGINAGQEGNAVYQARTPHFDFLWDKYPHGQLAASGEAVGLPAGQIGGSGVGHLTLGAGRVIYQDLMRINKSIESGDFFCQPVLLAGAKHVKKHQSALHLIGLVSRGGVHSYLDHLIALLQLAKNEKLDKVYIHVITDGRDVPPHSAPQYLEELEKTCQKMGVGQIASISGRFYAMDRDGNWQRTEKAAEVIIHGRGAAYSRAAKAVEEAYRAGLSDEFIEPVLILDEAGKIHPPRENDCFVCFNFRSDRMRQMTKKIIEAKKEQRWEILTFGEYEKKMPVKVLFPPQTIKNTLSDVIAKNHLKQAHIAETEKYAHVTYFFNGGREVQHKGEDHLLVPSLKSVERHEEKPEMRAREICAVVLEKLQSAKHHFILVNFANSDMVGHSGILQPTVQAIEALDECLGKLYEQASQNGYEMIITADHGNAENMFQKHNGKIVPHTAHTTNSVPYIIISDRVKKARAAGGLQNVAPTVLGLLNIKKPSEMAETLIEILDETD